jgi:hypothetical protein
MKKIAFLKSGLPDFSRYNIPKWGEKLPKDHKIYQMAIKHSNWLQIIPNGCKIFHMAKNVTTFSTPTHSKMYPNKHSWFGNIPSGNPVLDSVTSDVSFFFFFGVDLVYRESVPFCEITSWTYVHERILQVLNIIWRLLFRSKKFDQNFFSTADSIVTFTIAFFPHDYVMFAKLAY